MHPIWAAHPRTHLSTEYPPPGGYYKKDIHSYAQGPGQNHLPTVSL